MVQITQRAASIALALALVVSLYAEDRMRSGLWEVTTSTNVRQGEPVAHTSTTCYAPQMVELANSPANTLRQATEKSCFQTRRMFRHGFQAGQRDCFDDHALRHKNAGNIDHLYRRLLHDRKYSEQRGVATVTRMKARP